VNLVEPHIASLFGLHLPQPLFLFLTLALIVFLFWRDIREKPNVSGALWLPVVWLLIGMSRPFTEWLNIFGLHVGGGAASLEEGSPLDAFFAFAMSIMGLCILIQRKVRFSEVVLNNGWLIAFLLYCFISIAWSDFPFVAFKRWIKILGQPIMALIVLTEPDFEEALTRLMKRCVYVVVPVSILWIRYYPRLGRASGAWGGTMNQGITHGKNGLGMICLILGFFFFWYLLQTWRTERNTRRRNELRLIAGFLIGISWLLRQAHSATSTIALFVAILIVVFVGIRSINKNFIGTYILTALVVVAAAELAFGISADLSEALGRGSHMSGRTEIWKIFLRLQDHPILGAGYGSFHLGEQNARVIEAFSEWGLRSSDPATRSASPHNSYLETYLDLGLIGLSMLIGLLIATFWKIRFELFRNFEWGRYRLGLFVAVLLVGWGEMVFDSLTAVWFVFYIIAMDYPRTHLTAAQPPVGVERSEESREFAYAE
jgi:Lipid A core - O-antigen ligase and related enzymes